MKTQSGGCLLGLSFLLTSACEPPRPDENRSPAAAADPDGPSTPGGGNAGGGSGAFDFEADCGPGPDAELSFSKSNLLRSAAQCAQLRFCEFEAQALTLSEAASEYADDPTSEKLSEVQEAFVPAMLAWSRAELFQFGPTATTGQDMDNGQGIRVLTYAWPQASRCKVEEQVLSQKYQSEGFDDFVAVPVSSRGLFAVEYLSFYEGADNDCSDRSAVNQDGAWAALSEGELTELKANYLEGVTGDILKQARRLRQVWSPSGDDFEGRLASASAYMSEQEALNIVANALLYAAVEVKDLKIGVPAGLYVASEVPEVPFAGGATDQVLQNLRGFRDLFQGCGGEGLGFDDWLREAQHGDLADDILAALTSAEQAFSDAPDLASASETDFQQLHAVIEGFTDLLKGDFFGQGSPLKLTLPSAVESDTD